MTTTLPIQAETRDVSRRWRRTPTALAFVAGLAGLLALMWLAQSSGFAQQNASDLFAEAEDFFAKMEFQKALDKYEAAVQAAPADFAQRDYARLQIAICNRQLSKFDPAIEAFEKLIADVPDRPITVKVRRDYAHMLIRMPHFYTERENERRWGGWLSGATYHHVRHPNLQKAEAQINAARDLQQRLLIDSPASLTAETRWEWREMLATLHFESAGISELLEPHDRRWENRTFWQRQNPDDPNGPREVSLSAGKPEGEGWDHVPQQAFLVYPRTDAVMSSYTDAHTRFAALAAEFKTVIDGLKAADPARTDLAAHETRLLGFIERKGEAMYRQAAYLSRGRQASPEILRLVYGEANWRQYDPIAAIDAFLTHNVGHYRRPEAQILMAHQYDQTARHVEAVATLDKLIAAEKDSPWGKTAATMKTQIVRPQLGLNVTGNNPPGTEATITASVRNIRELSIETFRFDIERYLERSDYLRNPNRTLSNVASLLGDHGRANDLSVLQPYLTAIGTSQHKTADNGKHRVHAETLKTGVSEAGVYLVRVVGNGVFAANFVQLADKTLLSRPFSDRRLYFLSDRESGEPIAGQNRLTIKEYRWSPQGSYTHVAQMGLNRETGDAWHQLRVPPRHEIGQIDAFARGANGQVVFQTGQQGRWWFSRNFADSEIMGYTITDRPIYRPTHTVKFTSILRARQAGAFGFAPPRTGRDVWVTINDSRGSQILDQRYPVDEFGQIHGELTLGEEPPLGSYTLYMRWQGEAYNRFNSSTHYFRVEEYRKPEFAVNVSTDDSRVKVGSEVTAKIGGRYYFGAPVANGEVNYRIFRRPFAHQYRFPSPYDWLYGVQEMWHHRMSDHHHRHVAYGQELVAHGTGRLDETGAFEVKFQAGPAVLAKGADDPAVKILLRDDPNLKRFLESDFAYDVHVSVADSSRRVIEGRGSVIVTRQSFGLFSNYRNNFYRPNSRVEIELRSVAPSGAPVAVEGTLHLEKLERDWVADENGRLVLRDRVVKDLGKSPFATDRRGVLFFDRVFDEDGLYRLSFSAPDPEGGVVTHVNHILIMGEDSTGRGLRFDTLQVVPEKRFFAEGETIRCAVLTTEPGMTAHTLIELGDGGVKPDSYTIRTLEGAATVIEFEAASEFVPNVFLTVVSVQKNRVHVASTEVFIPPVREFLNVEVKPNKTEYSPGEEGSVEITATDSNGRPVEGQFAISVVDEAIYAIQPDTLTDIRKHFYGRRRYHHFNVEHSQNQRFWGTTVDTNNYGERFFYGSPEGPRMYPNGWFDRDHLTAKELEEIREGRSTLDSLRQQDGQARRNRAGGGGAPEMAREANMADGAVPSAPTASPATAGRAEARDMEAMDKAGAEFALADGDDAKAQGDAPAEPGEAEPVEPAERANFEDTAFFSSMVKTGSDGKATVRFKYPDNLTTWRIIARGATKATQVGEGRAETLVTKNIIVRLATPRFFMEHDRLMITTIVNNRFDRAVEVDVILDIPSVLTPDAAVPASGNGRLTFSRKVTVPANGEARQDWPVRVHAEGMMRITASAMSSVESDRVTMSFPAYRHGIEQFKTVAGAIAGADETRHVTIDLPESFDESQTWVRIGVNPTVATACIDAVPYLIEYPYGCIEQTMSRFMPAVVVRGTLKDLGIDLAAVRERRNLVALDEFERGNINRFRNSPVFDDGTLEWVIQAGLARIASWQNSDGGWGWFKGFTSDPYMTAYVVHGLTLAKQNGVSFDEGMITRAVSFLGTHFLVERNIHRAAFMAYALAPYHDSTAFGQREVYKRYIDTLMGRRADFNHLSRAYFALALHHGGRTADAQQLVANIEDYAKRDAQAGTAYWATSTDGWWYWWNNALETNTAILRALSAIAPQHADIEPLSRWVLNHRQGNAWESTKGTSLAILSLMDYARARGELDPDYTVEIQYGGKTIETIRVTKENMLAIKPAFYFVGDDLKAGKGRFTFIKKGRGGFAYTATLKTYNTSIPIEAAGYEIFLTRKYYKLTPKVQNEGATDGSQRIVYDRTELADLSEVQSGDLIEVELHIDAKNDYEYVMFADMKPAGCEAVSQRSGFTWADGLGVFIEFRDEKVAMFASWIPQGTHKLRYQLRAETPGYFHALPTTSEAMYAPLVRANSAEWRVTVKDKPQDGDNGE